MASRGKGKEMYTYKYFSVYISRVTLQVWCGLLKEEREITLGCRALMNARAVCFWVREEKFLNAKKELSIHTRHRNDVCFLWNKGREDGREKKGERIRRHGFRASRCECHREQYRRRGEHPVTYQSPLFRFYLLCCPPPRLFTQIASSSPTACLLLCAAVCRCRNSREGTMRPSNSKSTLSLGCQS